MRDRGWPLEKALPLATSNPASVLKLQHKGKVCARVWLSFLHVHIRLGGALSRLHTRVPLSLGGAHSHPQLIHHVLLLEFASMAGFNTAFARVREGLIATLFQKPPPPAGCCRHRCGPSCARQRDVGP